MRTITWLLLTMIVAGCLFACSSAPDVNDPTVKGVQDYCTMLQATYMQRDLNLLAKVATEKELKRVYPIVQMLVSTDTVMKTQVEKFKALSSKVSGSTAKVETEETWEYWWEDRSGKITKPKKKEAYRLRYELVNVNGQWKVDSLRHM